MGDVPSPPPSPPTSQKPSLPMLYYGLVIVGTAAVFLTVYNLIIIKWCTDRQGRPGQRARRHAELTASQSFQSRNLLSTFKYSKENFTASQDGGGSSSDYECPVCLSVFEEGEEVRQLPRCKHSFHAPCIDMWLYSHSDCPLCRAHVDPPLFCRRHAVAAPVITPENSRGGLMESAGVAV